MWATVRSEIVLGSNHQITGIRHHWTFDEFYTAMAVEGLDANKDGVYSKEELQPLAQVNVESLKDFDYFTFVHFEGEDDKLLKLRPPVDYSVDYDKSVLTLHFTLPLETPVDTHGKPVEVDVYDPSFFVAFGFATEKPVVLAGSETKGCSAKVETPDPETAADTKALTKSFFSQLGPNSNFGSQFAQTVTVKCKDFASVRNLAVALASCVLCAMLSLVFATAVARAELKPINPFAATEVAPAPPSAFAPRPVAVPFQATGPLGRLFAWVLDKQQGLQRMLATSVKGLKTDNPMAGAVTLAGLSFLYGILHAVGPGHGKTIISSYVVANEETVRRGVIISFIAAGLQALTAVVLVGLLLFGLNASGLQVNAWSNQLESVSYAMIALVGLYLLTTQLLRLFRNWRGVPAAHAADKQPAHSHAEHHSQDHAHHDHTHGHAHDHDHHDHGHDHQHHHHAPGEACDHIVDARQLAGPFSWRKVMAVVFSVGIRPCTGAILVLVFAVTQGVFWAGVGATFAMALGTAITVAVLATLALGSRELALKLGGGKCIWTKRYGPCAPSAGRQLSCCLAQSCL